MRSTDTGRGRGAGFFRLPALLLAAVFTAACLTCCSGSGSGGDGTSAVSGPETSEAAAPESDLVIAENGSISVNVVRGFSATDAEISAAKTVREYLLGLFPGGDVRISDDYSADGTYRPDDVEILIGNTSYPQTAQVKESLPYGDYTVCVRGNKLVAAVWAPVALPLLAQRLCDMLGKSLSSDGRSLTVRGSDTVGGTLSEYLDLLPHMEGAAPSNVISVGDSAYEILFMKATPEQTDAYIGLMERSGFTKNYDRDAGSSDRNVNRFAGFTGKGGSFAVNFTGANGYLRLTAEPEKNYFPGGDGKYEKKTTPLLTMIGRRFSTSSTYLGYDAGAGLECMMIRLSDGRFIVIDGGVSDNGNASYASAIYAKMLEQAPGGNSPVIAAWFITHSHADHVGGFKSFLSIYNGKVKIESVMMNLPSDADCREANDEGISSYTSLRSAMGGNIPDTPVYKLRTGQKFGIADAVIEVFYTQEDFVTKTRTIGSVKNNWNNSSLIFSVDIAGQRIMFPGDSQEIPNNLTAEVFGAALKSDILQVCHHGGIGGTNSFYACVDPAVALYTTSDVLVPVYIATFQYNDYLVSRLHVVEYWNAHDRITEFPLPYTPAGSGFRK